MDNKRNKQDCSFLNKSNEKEKQLVLYQMFLKFIRKRLLAILTLISITLGFIIGFSVRLLQPNEDTISLLGFPGEIFLKLLRMPIVPLVSSSIIVATASMSPKENGRIGLLYFTYTAVANFFSSALGVMLASVIQPGSDSNTSGGELRTVKSSLTPMDLVLDLLRNLVPDNVVRAALQKEATVYNDGISSEETAFENETSNGTLPYERSVVYVDSTNMLGLIFCSFMFGLATSKAGEKGLPFLNVFRSTLDIMLIALDWFLWFSPIGIMSLIAASIAAIDDLWFMFIKLALFVATVSGGLMMQQLIILPLVHVILTRNNPFHVHAISFKAWCMSFASASSAGAMPYMYLAAGKFKISNKVSSLCIPMGVTFNACGSVMFITASVLFLAQMNNLSLNIGQIMTVCLLAAISCMALPAVPSASLILVVILCTLFSIPAQSVGLLFAVEWFLDRIRTTSNVLCEMFALACVWHVVKSDFKEEKEEGELKYVVTTDVSHLDAGLGLISKDEQQSHVSKL